MKSLNIYAANNNCILNVSNLLSLKLYSDCVLFRMYLEYV